MSIPMTRVRAQGRAVLASLMLLLAAGVARAALPEYDVKAALLYKVSKFVSWPSTAASGSAFALCVIGSDPFGASLAGVGVSSIKGRRVKILRYPSPNPDVQRCDVAFISTAESQRLTEVLATLKGRPVLTISDTPGFASRGGMIGLETRVNKIAFEVNVAASKAAGIEISSQLLQLATLVETRPPEQP